MPASLFDAIFMIDISLEYGPLWRNSGCITMDSIRKRLSYESNFFRSWFPITKCKYGCCDTFWCLKQKSTTLMWIWKWMKNVCKWIKNLCAMGSGHHDLFTNYGCSTMMLVNAFFVVENLNLNLPWIWTVWGTLTCLRYGWKQHLIQNQTMKDQWPLGAIGYSWANNTSKWLFISNTYHQLFYRIVLV